MNWGCFFVPFFKMDISIFGFWMNANAHRCLTSCRRQQQVHLASCIHLMKRKCLLCKFMLTNDYSALMQHWDWVAWFSKKLKVAAENMPAMYQRWWIFGICMELYVVCSSYIQMKMKVVHLKFTFKLSVIQFNSQKWISEKLSALWFDLIA